MDKDYAILQMIYKGGAHVYGSECDKVGCDIFSVQRLADKEIFKVKQETNYGIIEKFYRVGDGEMFIHFTDGNEASLNSIV